MTRRYSNLAKNKIRSRSSPKGKAGSAKTSCPQEEECPHDEVIRAPETPQSPFIDFKARKKKSIQQLKKRIERLNNEVKKEESRGKLRLADELRKQITGEERNLLGAQFELEVGEQTNAKEMDVKFTCKKCGETLGDFDVVTDKGIVKECKASWNQVNEAQFLKNQKRAQDPILFGPGTIVHIAIPKGQRNRLDNKFKDKQAIAGKIQEH
ncbi:hypothetical protein [Archangium sp.]|uniref:hypothetical protein n=1 Tax=Archangium sp. TaxID=1872627 RepID=UPI002D229CC6|nr:hypothetical protein [Archangium sp.]HYO52804.1 hypothetical protein [Archangium sp.]